MIKKISLVLITILCAASVAQTRQSPLSTALAFPTLYASYSMRDGYRKYDGVDKYEHLPHDDMFIFGGAVGRRFTFRNTARLRGQTVMEIGWGKSENETFNVMYDEWSPVTVTEYLNLMTFGNQTDLHILFPSSTNSRRTYFLSIGPGLHSASFHYTLKAKGGAESEPNGKIRTVSISGNIGAGVEQRLISHRGVSAAYNLRVWDPVRYDEFGQLFPMGVKYHELFLTHSLQIQLLLPRLRSY